MGNIEIHVGGVRLRIESETKITISILEQDTKLEKDPRQKGSIANGIPVRYASGGAGGGSPLSAGLGEDRQGEFGVSETVKSYK